MTYFFPVASFLVQTWQLCFKIILPSFQENIKQIGCPAYTSWRFNLRFICKCTWNSFAEFTSDIFLITFHGYINKLLSNTRIEQIDVRKTTIPVGCLIVS